MKRWILTALTLTLVCGCGDNEIGLEKRRPNSPPETTLASGPPDSTTGTVYQVRLFWSGSDRDGTIDHYDFILIDHPPITSHIDERGDPDTRVVVEIPDPLDPRWTGTTSTDSTFITLADTLRFDPRVPPENPDEERELIFERWHTFFVRAVDNEGDYDPTPDYRSFNSTNIAPYAWLQPPIKARNAFEGPPVIVFQWDGIDPVGDGTFKDPVASRHVIIPTEVDIDEDNIYLNFPDSLYTLPVGSRWSPWRRWDAVDGSGKRAVVRGLNRIDGQGNGHYIFAVQVMDEAGAISPLFDWQTPGRNNVAMVRVTGAVGPRLRVEDRFLGTFVFGGGARPVKLDIAAGQPLEFRWAADASHYGGEIVAYRYGWNIRDPEDPQQWDQSWSATLRRAPSRTFRTGSHRFFVEARDNADTITRAVFELTVHTVTRARDLLWVDDSDHQTDFTTERAEDERWLGIFEELAAQSGFMFDPSRDVFDVVDNRKENPPIGKVFDAKVVVWTNRSGGNFTSSLRDLAQFFDPIPERNHNTTRSFNFLNGYLANEGAMWISGFRPAKQLWPIERARGQENKAVNVTNWDDPIEPHPLIDSVGTISLLYKMGIEMFDAGSALDSERKSLPHFCEGFSRASASALRSTSDVVLDHAHVVAIPGEDADTSLEPRTYGTSSERDHTHAIGLTPEDFIALRAGFTLTLESTSSDEPEPHTHLFEIVDAVGVYGAPPLRPGSDWAQHPSPRGRTNIEIYNMPNAMAGQQPPLTPLPGISTAPYLYVSGPSVREDPERNFSYPLTADRQPALVLARGAPFEPFYTRAFCGFEPYLLTRGSHRDLTQYILVRHFRLGHFDR